MQTDPSSYFPTLGTRSGVCVVDGHGVRIRVERGHLVITDGIGPASRERRFPRAGHGLKRVVVVGQTGYASLESHRWLADLGIGFIHIDRAGKVLVSSAGFGVDHPALRRAQALAGTNSVGLEIARMLVRAKVSGQAGLLTRLPHGRRAAPEIERQQIAIESAKTTESLRLAEALAAASYWSAWDQMSVPFARKDSSRIPDHWATFGRRSSAVSGTTRNASNPPNAILGYLYALLEGEARLACLAAGLDPGLGVLHADQRARDSLALDLMETARPNVDAYVLDLLQSSVFRTKDFFETRQGICRLCPPLTHHLAGTTTVWAKTLAPFAERIARMLADASNGRVRNLPTHLTQENRSRGRDGIRRRAKSVSSRSPLMPKKRCDSCGADVSSAKQNFCDPCRAERRFELNDDLIAKGTRKLAQLRAEGRDPAHGGRARELRGGKLAKANRARAAWERSNKGVRDPSAFTNEILPGLAHMSPSELARETGLSRGYCALILKGLCVPHPRHWEALGRIAKK